jgi:hypothetical protein
MALISSPIARCQRGRRDDFLVVELEGMERFERHGVRHARPRAANHHPGGSPVVAHVGEQPDEGTEKLTHLAPHGYEPPATDSAVEAKVTPPAVQPTTSTN